MFALAPPNTTTTARKRKRTTLNILPCAIYHNGPVSTTPRYWSPTITPRSESNGLNKTKTSYFRGRKLAGRTLKLPAGYTGLVLQKTDKVLPVTPRVPTAEELRAKESMLEEGISEDEEVGKEGEVEVKMLEQQAGFDELVVWDHEAVPDGEDVYVRGVEEWVGFAEAMHCEDKPAPAKTNGTT